MSTPRLIFFAGEECLLRHGTWVRRTAPDEDGTFEDVSRSGAVGPYIDRDGVLRNADADWPRPDWVDGDGILDTPTLLGEAARTNLATNDDPDTWFDSAPVGAGVSDPAGGTDAYTISDDSGASALSRYFTPSFTGSTQKGLAFVVRERDHSADGTGLLLRDQTAGAQRLHLQIEAWTDGEPTTITEVAGTYIGKRRLADDWWIIYGRSDAVTAGNDHRLVIFPAYNFPGGDVSLTGSIDIYRVNVVDDAVPSRSILNASETRNADTIHMPFLPPPQEMTAYVKFREWTAPPFPSGFLRVWQIGNASDTGARVMVMRNGGADSYRLQLSDGSDTRVASVDVNPSYDDTVELRVVLHADSSSELGGAVGGGAESTVSAAALTEGLPSAWGDTRWYWNSVGTSAHGVGGLLAAKVALGHHSLDDMRAA